jgi:hypothetical protein
VPNTARNERLLPGVDSETPVEAAADEGFWIRVQQAYTVDRNQGWRGPKDPPAEGAAGGSARTRYALRTMR